MRLPLIFILLLVIPIVSAPPLINISISPIFSEYGIAQVQVNWSIFSNPAVILSVDRNVTYPNGSILYSVTDGVAVNQSVNFTSPANLSINGSYLAGMRAEDVIGGVTYDLKGFNVSKMIPRIIYVNPTPVDDKGVNDTSIYVNVSAVDADYMYGFTNFDDSLVGWWRMDNDSSAGENNSKVLDWSGKGFNGTVTNASSNISGKFAGSFEFFGTGEYIRMPDIAQTDTVTQLTVSAWVKPRAADAGILDIVTKYRSGFGSWSLFRNGGEKYSFEVRNKSNQAAGAVSDSTYADTTWHHVVGTYNGTYIQVFVDGVAADSTPAALTNPIIDTAYPVCLGKQSGGALACDTSGSQMNGTIDEVLIFNRSFSAQEIAALYNASAPNFFNNYTNLAIGNHTFQSFVVDTDGNMNMTEKRSVILGIDPRCIYLTGNFNTPCTCDIQVPYNLTAGANMTITGQGTFYARKKISIPGFLFINSDSNCGVYFEQ
jgi:hypothetical protein